MIKKIGKMNQTKFEKLAIRRAMREMKIEAQLDTLLDASETFRKDWNDATIIDLADLITGEALKQAGFDVDAVKLKIAGIE